LNYATRHLTSEQPVDLIITDIQMPEMDGVTLLEKLAEQAISVPVLALTAYGDRSLLIELLRRGCSDYLDKPVDETQLLEHVQTMLQRRRSAAEQLAQLFRKAEIGEHAAKIAHDFRNLITTVNGFADLAMMQQCSQEKACHYLNNIQAGCARAARLTERLLAYGTARVSAEPAPLDCNRIISDARDLLETVVGRNIRMEFDLTEPLWAVESIEVHIEQLLMNLLFNARAAITEFGTITVQTANEPEPGGGYCAAGNSRPNHTYTRISVIDTGKGIPLDQLPHVFDAGHSGSGSTGMGLSIVKEIVERHKGFVRIESLPDVGSSFHVFLPAIDPYEREGGV
jgi:signal transduction histidine kinase